MTLSPASIMLKSAIAWPTWRCSFLLSLLASKACLRVSRWVASTSAESVTVCMAGFQFESERRPKTSTPTASQSG